MTLFVSKAEAMIVMAEVVMKIIVTNISYYY